jgi:hypothetical protein
MEIIIEFSVIFLVLLVIIIDMQIILQVFTKKLALQMEFYL